MPRFFTSTSRCMGRAVSRQPYRGVFVTQWKSSHPNGRWSTATEATVIHRSMVMGWSAYTPEEARSAATEGNCWRFRDTLFAELESKGMSMCRVRLLTSVALGDKLGSDQIARVGSFFYADERRTLRSAHGQKADVNHRDGGIYECPNEDGLFTTLSSPTARRRLWLSLCDRCDFITAGGTAAHSIRASDRDAFLAPIFKPCTNARPGTI